MNYYNAFNVVMLLLLFLSCASRIKAMGEDSTKIQNETVSSRQAGDTEAKDINKCMLESRGNYETEFLTFFAPEEDENADDEEIKDFLKLIKRPRILVIEAPNNMTVFQLYTDSMEYVDLGTDPVFRENMPSDN